MCVRMHGAGMRKFLVEEKQFNPERIESVIKRLQKAQETKGTQARLENFFVKKDPPNGVKRPAPAPAKGKDAKKAKTNGTGGGRGAGGKASGGKGK